MKTAEELLRDAFYNGKYIELHSGDVEDIINIMEEYAAQVIDSAVEESLKRIIKTKGREILSGVNFDDINVPEQKEQTTNSKFKRVEKGAQVLTITKVEDVTAGTGTPGFEITFHSDRYDADFTHKFWATGKAAPRLQSLMIGFTGAKATGKMTTEQLAAVLVGKSSNCIVDADIRINNKDGKEFRNEYATLRYADFANLAIEFKDSDARVNEPRVMPQTESVLDKVETENSDLPF